ncbi:MAG: protein-glutamate O-methyltransferase CheR [Desulfobulbaceae bacterium]|nr:protein-glutamate O-methyltransferase CheR [Desulfobulbaceae bacterium]
MITISPTEQAIIIKHIYNISGIALTPSKKYLIETRLTPVIKELGLSNYNDLYKKALADRTKKVDKKIIDAISVNETLFFRDNGPFQLLQQKIFPEAIDARQKRKARAGKIPLRIWSAACSTGQEVYSVAIVLKELLPNINQYNITLVGTDISDAAVSRASSGKYNKFEIERGMAKDKLNKYFTISGGFWKIKDEIRAMASFKKFNLMQPFNTLGKFDIILCRNVAIYFNMEDKKQLFNRLAQALEPDGYLLIGSTESLTGICPRFKPKRHLRSTFYQLN